MNGCVESFNGRRRDELLAGEMLDTLLEAEVLIERWRKVYNTVRPHSSLGYPPPGCGVASPLSARFGYASASGQGRIPCQAYRGDRGWFYSWGQVTTVTAYGIRTYEG